LLEVFFKRSKNKECEYPIPLNKNGCMENAYKPIKFEAAGKSAKKKKERIISLTK
jgi:hypothetical protein